MTRCLYAIVAGVIALAGCGQPPVREVDLHEAKDIAANALLFDLDETPRPAAGLLLQTRSPQSQLRVLGLPFALRTSPSEKLLLVASSSQGRSTLLTVLTAPALPESSTVRLELSFEQAEDSDFSRDDLRGYTYFLESGLKRRFFYRSPTPTELSSEPWKSMVPVLNTSLTHLIVRLPKGTEVFERSASALAPVLERDTPRGKVRAYVHDKTSASPIDLRYQIPPTKRQEQVFEYGLKFFVAIVAPLVSLALLTSDKVRSARARKIVLIAGSATELAVLLGLIWWAFFIQSVAGLSAILDVALAVIGAAATIGLAFIKKSGDA